MSSPDTLGSGLLQRPDVLFYFCSFEMGCPYITIVPGLELLILDYLSLRCSVTCRLAPLSLAKDEPARLCSRALVLYDNKGRHLGSLCFYLISQQS